MKIGRAFKMALRSIGAKKGRTALTMLGIIIGVASVVIMVSVVHSSLTPSNLLPPYVLRLTKRQCENWLLYLTSHDHLHRNLAKMVISR